MTLPPVIRIFFAIDLPPTAKERLGRYISVLKKISQTHGIRWSRPDNLHITLQFLAEVNSEHISQLLENVRQEISGKLAHVSLTFGQPHVFPNPYRPRVIVLEVAPQEPLAILSSLVGRGIQLSQYLVENRLFRAHLTLGRIKHAQGMNLDFLTKAPPLLENEVIELNEVVLFRSEPQPEGSQYTILERIAV